MTTQAYFHPDIVDSEVRAAYCARLGHKAGYAKAGRVISGLLKAGVKARKIRKTEHCGRCSGSAVWYHLTDEQLAEIRREAIARAASL